jgi:manganese/iron transport system ATP-binding protein
MLEVEHLAVNYQDISAVEDVSFSIDAGQVVGVIGLNGAGKSTVFKAMLGLVPSCGGTVKYRSRFFLAYYPTTLISKTLLSSV